MIDRFRRGWAPLLISVFLHVALAILVNITPDNAPINPTTAVEFTAIEIPEAAVKGSSEAAPAKKSASSPRSRVRGAPSGRSLQRFLPQTDYGLAQRARPGMFNSGASELEVPDDPLANWGEGGAEFGRVRDYAFMERFQEQINGLLFYPGVLAYHRIEGDVRARLVIAENGGCDWGHSRIESGEAHLRVYILSVLKKACSLNHKSLTRIRKSSNIDMHFDFEVVSDGRDRRPEREVINGNVLFFYRSTARPVTEWRLGPLTGVFPLPFVNVDFTWLMLNWEKHVEGHDRMEEFKPPQG